VVITHVAGLSESIRRAGAEVGVKNVFSANDTLKKRLTHVKPKRNTREKELIYRIPCECGAKYIGETGRPLETRVSEHRRNLLKLSRDREIGIEEESLSSLLALMQENKHQVLWEEVTILGSENNAKKRKFHEAAVMNIEDNVISRPSLDIPPLWHSMLRDEKKEIIKERKPSNQVDNREKPVTRKRSRDSDNERKEGN
jgi:predicted GIY-YIG superfamily endonuclease